MRDVLVGSTKIRNIMTESLNQKGYRLFARVAIPCKQWLVSRFN